MTTTESASLLARIAELERQVAILMDITTRMADIVDDLRSRQEDEDIARSEGWEG